jgi:uncharacterized membrane protein required for colicin V production
LKEFISRLTWVDYLAMAAVLRGCYVGYKSGFFPELLRIAAYLLTAVVTLRFRESVSQFLTLNTFLNASTAEAVALGGLIVGVFVLAKLISLLILKMLKLGEGGFFYRLIGLVLGGCRWVVLLSLAFMLISGSPLAPLRTDIKERSVSGPQIERVAPMLFDFLSSLSPQLSVSRKA